LNAQQPESYYRDNCDHILENTCATATEFEIKSIGFFKDLIGKMERDDQEHEK